MSFYDLSKEERLVLVDKINIDIESDLVSNSTQNIITYFSDEDTYIRKTGYLAIGKIFYAKPELQNTILSSLKILLNSETDKVRQTVVNAAGEIGKFHFNKVQMFFDIGLFDKHHSVRNAIDYFVVIIEDMFNLYNYRRQLEDDRAISLCWPFGKVPDL